MNRRKRSTFTGRTRMTWRDRSNNCPCMRCCRNAAFPGLWFE